MVGTLKPYLMPKNLFELFALIGGGDTQTSGMSNRIITPGSSGETFTDLFLSVLNSQTTHLISLLSSSSVLCMLAINLPATALGLRTLPLFL